MSFLLRSDACAGVSSGQLGLAGDPELELRRMLEPTEEEKFAFGVATMISAVLLEDLHGG